MFVKGQRVWLKDGCGAVQCSIGYIDGDYNPLGYYTVRRNDSIFGFTCGGEYLEPLFLPGDEVRIKSGAVVDSVGYSFYMPPIEATYTVARIKDGRATLTHNNPPSEFSLYIRPYYTDVANLEWVEAKSTDDVDKAIKAVCDEMKEKETTTLCNAFKVGDKVQLGKPRGWKNPTNEYEVFEISGESVKLGWTEVSGFKGCWHTFWVTADSIEPIPDKPTELIFVVESMTVSCDNGVNVDIVDDNDNRITMRAFIDAAKSIHIGDEYTVTITKKGN